MRLYHLEQIQNPGVQNIPVGVFSSFRMVNLYSFKSKGFGFSLPPKGGQGMIGKASLKKENNADSFFITAFRVYLLHIINDVAHEDHLSEYFIQQ